MYQLKQGDFLGQFPYRIEIPLGQSQGNMSEVYLATIPYSFRQKIARGYGVRRQNRKEPPKVQLPKQVIVKIAAPNQIETNNQGIGNEQLILPKLDNPHIVRILKIWRVNGQELGYQVRAELPGTPWFCVFEYLPGGSLADWLASSAKSISLKHAQRVAAELATAIRYLHQHSYVHMDIKPANILFRRRTWFRKKPLETVLIDFGIARRIGQLSKIGTWDYMSPERRQATMARESIRAQPHMDIFALGLVIYEMLSGRNPHAGKSSYTFLPEQIDGHVFGHSAHAHKLHTFVRSAVDELQSRPKIDELF